MKIRSGFVSNSSSSSYVIAIKPGFDPAKEGFFSDEKITKFNEETDSDFTVEGFRNELEEAWHDLVCIGECNQSVHEDAMIFFEYMFDECKDKVIVLQCVNNEPDAGIMINLLYTFRENVDNMPKIKQLAEWTNES